MTQPPNLPPELFTVHLSLDQTEPLVWRRLTIPSHLTLAEVHEVVQAAMGWTDSHLHRFSLGPGFRGTSFLTDFDEGEEGTHEGAVGLDQVLRKPGDTLSYAYDFGDGWEHTIRLEARSPLLDKGFDANDADAADGASAAYLPVTCLDGAGACPPEDVGGIWAFHEMAHWARHDFDSEHAPQGRDPEDVDELREWLPPDWHPDTFDVEDANRALARLGPRETDAVRARLPEEVRRLLETVDPDVDDTIDRWLAHEGWSEPGRISPDDAEALTRPWRTVLDIVGDGINLTSAGYLPPRAVEAIFATLDLGRDWIGKGNREDLTLPVRQLREQTRSVGLIRLAKGRLTATVRGRALHAQPVALLDHMIARMPFEKDTFDQLAALLTLVGVGGGEHLSAGHHLVTDVVCRVLGPAGWQSPTGPLEPWHVVWATGETRMALQLMLGGVDDEHVAFKLEGELARRIVLGQTAP